MHNDFNNFDMNGPTFGSSFNASHSNDAMLPDEMVVSAVTKACDFFGIPEVPVINAEGTCVWPNDSSTYDDDVFGFNREQLMELGVSGEDSLTLIYTHECAHRTLQGAFNDSWEEELACDFFAGVHAGMKGMSIDNFEASLGQLPGSDSHPNGALRADFIEFGQQVAQEMHDRHIEPTYENCLARLNYHLEDKGGLIAEYRERFGVEVDNSAIYIGKTESITDASHEDDNFEALHMDDSKGLTAADRNSAISNAKIKIGQAEQDIKHHEYMIKSKLRCGSPCSSDESGLKDANNRLKAAKEELNKAYQMKVTEH